MNEAKQGRVGPDLMPEESRLVPGLYHIDDVAQWLGVSRETVVGWCEDGLPWVRVGRARWVFRDALEGYLRARQNGMNRAPGGARRSPAVGE